MAMSISDILAAFLAFGLLHLGGYHGHAGWRWLFLFEVRLFHSGLYGIALLIQKSGVADTSHWTGFLHTHAPKSYSDQ